MPRCQKKRSSLVAQLKRLDFESLPLVGRDKELEELKAAYLSGEHSLIGVSGPSGVGKTALVEAFARNVGRASKECGEKDVWFLFGKYDQQTSSLPYSAISMALTTLSFDYETEIEDIFEKNRIDDETLALVLGIVPDLKECFVSRDPDDSDSSDQFKPGVHRSDQIRDALSLFIRICCTDRKIVLCLDDVQWADTASLELVEALASSKEGSKNSKSNLTLVLNWRSDELKESHELSTMLSKLSPLIVEVGNLNVDSLHEVVCGVLERSLEDKDARELSNTVHRKTQGNVFFTVQVLTWLQRNKLLYYSVQEYRWEWDISDINAETNLADNLVAIVTDKLQNLPSLPRRAVMVASCLGSHFDKTLVLELLDANVLCSSSALARANRQGKADFEFLEENDVICRRVDSETYRFSHDQVQQAAYSLFENQECKEKTHFAIGQFLLKCTTIGDDVKQFLATDQLNLGASMVKTDADKFLLMKNNHEAALLAVRKSAFVQAERFHRAALQLLPKKRLWQDHYELALTMSSTLAETSLTLGKFDNVERLVDEVINYATEPSDACRILRVKIDCLNSMNRLQEAFDFGYKHILKVPKLKLSRRPGKFHVIREFLRAKHFLKKMPIEYLLQAEQCNTVNLGYQRLVNLLADNAFLRDDEDAMMYLYMKVLNMAFVQGPSRCTGVGLVFYGAFFGVLKDLDASYQVSHWVIAIEDRFKSRAYYSRIHLPLHSFLSHLRQSMHSLLDPLLECYKAAMRCGDMMLACFSVTAYVISYFHCGLNLNPLICDIRSYREVFLNKNGCDSIRCSLDVVGQMALNLTGASSDPFVLDGEFFDHERHRTTIIEAGRGQVRLTYWCAYICGGYILDPSSDHVMKAFNELYRSKNEGPKICHDTCWFLAPAQCMYFCLAAIALERRTGKRFYARKRRLLTKIVKKFVDNGVPGVSHRLLLIEAETMALNHRLPELQVKRSFDTAISTASRTGFLHESAMANERCGEFFVRRRDPEWAEYYFNRAMELYGDWGALQKVMTINPQHPAVEDKSKSDGLSYISGILDQSKSSSLRSRERFKAEEADMHNADVSQIMFDVASSELL